jgi:hypothetical protein
MATRTRQGSTVFWRLPGNERGCRFLDAGTAIANRRFNVSVRRLALPLLALVLAAPAGGGTARPVLRPLSLQPLAVQGLRFRANERVTLLLASEGVASKRIVRAGVRGRFTVRYALRVDRCTSYTVQAIGSRGSRATLQGDALDCMEP